MGASPGAHFFSGAGGAGADVAGAAVPAPAGAAVFAGGVAEPVAAGVDVVVPGVVDPVAGGNAGPGVFDELTADELNASP